MIDFDIDVIEAACDSLIADDLEYLAPAGMNDSVKVKAFITRLRQAEKDAARYRWLRDEAALAHISAPLVLFTDCNGNQTTFNAGCVLHDEDLDSAVDEAMNGSNN